MGAVRREKSGLAGIPSGPPAPEPGARSAVVVGGAGTRARRPESVRQALPGRGATARAREPFYGNRAARPADRMVPPLPVPVPPGLDEQIRAASDAEAVARAEVLTLEQTRADALAGRLWEKLPELDDLLLTARTSHAAAAGQLAGLESVARDVAETIAAEQAQAAAERQHADALDAEAAAIKGEQDALNDLDSRLADFWELVGAAQVAFADAGAIEQRVRRHRQSRNDARAVMNGDAVPVRAMAPNRTVALRDDKPGVRELLDLRP